VIRKLVSRVVLSAALALGFLSLSGGSSEVAAPDKPEPVVSTSQLTCPSGQVLVAIDLDPLVQVCLVIGEDVVASQLVSCPTGQVLTVQAAVIVGGVLEEGILLCVAVGT
jgi:hypothetical protein